MRQHVLTSSPSAPAAFQTRAHTVPSAPQWSASCMLLGRRSVEQDRRHSLSFLKARVTWSRVSIIRRRAGARLSQPRMGRGRVTRPRASCGVRSRSGRSFVVAPWKTWVRSSVSRPRRVLVGKSPPSVKYQNASAAAVALASPPLSLYEVRVQVRSTGMSISPPSLLIFVCGVI